MNMLTLHSHLRAGKDGAIERYEAEISARVTEHVLVGNAHPIVYAAGSVVNEALKQFKSLKRVRVISPTDGIEDWTTSEGHRFLVDARRYATTSSPL